MPGQAVEHLDGYAYTAPRGKWVYGANNYFGELGLPPPNLDCALGQCNGIQIPWPPAGPSAPPRPAAQVQNPRTYPRSYAAFLACENGEVMGNSDQVKLTGLINMAPLIALGSGNFS